jgi:hypothetical protein
MENPTRATGVLYRWLDGIGLSYTKDPIRISGMFLRATPIDGVEQYSYYGSAQLSLAKFSVSGIGAYSKLIEPKPDGAISLFIYAMYAGTIGGPAFFFVTGIAAGFGYNRRVKVPSIREVNTFPLVTMALNPNPAKLLACSRYKVYFFQAYRIICTCLGTIRYENRICHPGLVYSCMAIKGQSNCLCRTGRKSQLWPG